MLRRLGGMALVGATAYMAADATADALMYLKAKRWASSLPAALLPWALLHACYCMPSCRSCPVLSPQLPASTLPSQLTRSQ